MIKKLCVSTFLTVTFSLQAFAEEIAPTMEASVDAHAVETHAAAAAHHSSGGLPQLDPSSFASQVFWLILVFSFLYLFFSKKSLPDIAQVIENRNDRIQNDLDTAQNLKNEVASVQKAYEDNLAKSRNEAFALHKDMEEKIKQKTESEARRLQDSASAHVADLERNIARARDVAMEDMNRIASEIAIEAAEKIIGQRPDMNEASAIVKSLHKTTKPAKAA